jgi:DNA-binding CsgD family transcriptional regulator
MGRLAERRARDVLKTLAAIGAAATDVDGFARAGVHALPGLVGADLTTLSVCALEGGKREVTGFPERALSAADIACFDRFFFAHPLVRYHSAHADGGSHRISDSVPDVAFRRTALYAEYYRRIRIEHAVAVPLHVDGRVLVSFVLNRSGRDFDDDDLAALEAAREPLALLYRQARAVDAARATVARFRAWLDAEGWCEIEIDAALHIRRASRRALAMLGAATPAAGLRPGVSLPTTLAAWLGRTRRGAPAGAVLTLRQGTRRFTLRALPAVEDGGWLLYVSECAAAAATRAAGECREPAPVTPAALSPREREVLDWVAAGKSDAQTAAILGISARTVQKHLEHVYVKLGVEGRMAAVTRAREFGGASGL